MLDNHSIGHGMTRALVLSCVLLSMACDRGTSLDGEWEGWLEPDDGSPAIPLEFVLQRLDANGEATSVHWYEVTFGDWPERVVPRYEELGHCVGPNCGGRPPLGWLGAADPEWSWRQDEVAYYNPLEGRRAEACPHPTEFIESCPPYGFGLLLDPGERGVLTGTFAYRGGDDGDLVGTAHLERVGWGLWR